MCCSADGWITRGEKSQPLLACARARACLVEVALGLDVLLLARTSELK